MVWGAPRSPGVLEEPVVGDNISDRPSEAHRDGGQLAVEVVVDVAELVVVPAAMPVTMPVARLTRTRMLGRATRRTTVLLMWEPGPGVVCLPDGRTVRGRGLRQGAALPRPDHGVYLLGSDPGPFDWSSRWVRWRDLWTPVDTEDALEALWHAYDLATDHRVEVACEGGTGRTGCALAVMAIWAGVDPADAVAWVRRSYRRRAVEMPWQRRWVLRAPLPPVA